MLYRTWAPIGMVLVLAIITAMVAAQDDTRSSASGSTVTNRAEPTPARPVRSALQSRIGSGVRSDTAATDARPSLTDRLKQIRDGALGTANPAPPAWNSATANRSSNGSDRDIGPPPVPIPDSPELAVPTTISAVPTTPTLELVPPSAAHSDAAAVSESMPSSATRREVITPRAKQGASGSAKTNVLSATQAPVLRSETQGKGAIVIGKEALFVVRLVNDGTVVAEGVSVRVALPSWVQVVKAETRLGPVQPQDDGSGQQRLTWTADSIAAGGAELLDLTVKPTDSRPFDLAVDWTVRPTSAVTQITVQRPELAVALFGPKDIQYGKSAVFTIQLTNPGTGDADEVVLEFMYGQRRLEPKRIGQLAAGQQTEVEVELSAFEAGLLRVNAVATGAGSLQAEATEELLVRRGQLVVEVLGPPVEFAGTPAAYRVRVANTGNATASDVMASILLPRGAKPLASGEASESTDAGMSWNVGTLSPGAERTLEFTCELTMAGPNRVEATVKASDDLESMQAFVTEVKALADLKLVINDPPGPTPIGEQATFEVRILNRGTMAAERVNVVAQFSEGIEPIEAVGSPANIVPGQVVFQPIGQVEPGAELVLKVVARADRDGIHRFRAEVTCGDPETRLVAEESTYFFDSKASRTARN